MKTKQNEKSFAYIAYAELFLLIKKKRVDSALREENIFALKGAKVWRK